MNRGHVEFRCGHCIVDVRHIHLAMWCPKGCRNGSVRLLIPLGPVSR